MMAQIMAPVLEYNACPPKRRTSVLAPAFIFFLMVMRAIAIRGNANIVFQGLVSDIHPSLDGWPTPLDVLIKVWKHLPKMFFSHFLPASNITNGIQ